MEESNPGTIVSYVAVDLQEIAKCVKVVQVKKNTTIPADLAEQVEAKGINFSALLIKALKEELGV